MSSHICTDIVFRCSYNKLSESVFLIDVVGCDPCLSAHNTIPDTNVVFTGSTAVVSIPDPSCNTLIYDSCLCGVQIQVVQLLIAESTSILSVSSSATPYLTSLNKDQSAVITFSNCIQNTACSCGLSHTRLEGSLYSSNPELEITAVHVPDNFTLKYDVVTKTFYYKSPLLELAPNQTVCFPIQVTVLCKAGISLASISNKVELVGSNTSSAGSVAFVQCNDPCAVRPCLFDKSCGGRLPGVSDGVSIYVPTDYPTIQAAVTAAESGDIIKVGPGTYDEQIVIPAGKDNISIKRSMEEDVIILTTAVGGTVITVTGAQGITIDGLIIKSASSAPSGRTGIGIAVTNNGSAMIYSNIITADTTHPISGIQMGAGINVDNGSSAWIEGNIINQYQKSGVRVNGINSCAYINTNAVSGIGPTDIIAQNGIQVSRGATALVENNTTTNNSYTGDTASSCGIVVFETPITSNVCLQSNTSKSNDLGLGMDIAAGVLAQLNNFSGNLVHGVYAGPDTKENTFIKNTILDSDFCDIQDESVGLGTSGTANTYLCNQCGCDNKGGGICHL